VAPGASPSWSQLQRGTNLRIWRAGRIPALLLLAFFTVSHLAAEGAWVFVDHFNLVLHEAGHVFFMWAPRTLHILGGTIGQLAWPIFFALYFWIARRDRFAASVCVWWLGESLMNVARYMADANFLELPLVGGGEHDWELLFTQWNMLHRAGRTAAITRGFGTVLMLGGYAAMLYLTIKPRQQEVDAPLPD